MSYILVKALVEQMSKWQTEKVIDLQRAGILLVEDGNHGEYRPRPNEFVDQGAAFIRVADINDGQLLFNSASKISKTARERITKGVGATGDVLLSHKGTVGKMALVPDGAPHFVRITLRRYKYLPDHQEEAIRLVLDQADGLSEAWSR